MDASSHTYDWLLTPFPNPLWRTGDGAENFQSKLDLTRDQASFRTEQELSTRTKDITFTEKTTRSVSGTRVKD